MKLFLRINYPHSTGNDKKESFGIHSANTQLLVNMIRYSQEIDEFGLVITGPEEENSLKELFPYRRLKGHVFRDKKELINVLQYYNVFFMGGYGIYDILKCESFFNKGLSIVGLTHSLHLEDIARSLMGASELCSEKDVLICTSSAARKSVETILQGSVNRLRLETIPLGVDVDRYCLVDEEVKKEMRRRFGLREDTIIFLCLGRLSPDEKMELAPLLKAFAELVGISELGEKAYLLIVGREHNEGYTKILSDLITKLDIKNQVNIISDYKASDIPLYYCVADVFVSPSDNVQETFGLTVVEAMASSLPVIVSDWDGYRDTVVDGTTGFLIPTYWADCGISWHKKFKLAQSVAVDMDKLVECMQALLENGELRKTMGEAARCHVESNLAWERVIKQYDILFKQLASGTRNRLEVNSRKVADSSNISLAPADIFNSYPSEFVTEDFRVRLRDIDGFATYSNVLQLVEGEIVNHIANLITKDINRVGEIAQILGQKHGIAVQKTLFQIMIMLKYGVFAPADQCTKSSFDQISYVTS